MNNIRILNANTLLDVQIGYLISCNQNIPFLPNSYFFKKLLKVQSLNVKSCERGSACTCMCVCVCVCVYTALQHWFCHQNTNIVRDILFIWTWYIHCYVVLHHSKYKILFWHQYRAFFIIYNLTNDCTIISNTTITNNMFLQVPTFKTSSSGSSLCLAKITYRFSGRIVNKK